MAFPNTGEEGAGQPFSDSSLTGPDKKPVEFIVKTKGAEEYLLGILKSGETIPLAEEIPEFQLVQTCVEIYLEDEEQLDLVVGYVKEVDRDTKNLHHILRDGIRFISDVLLPEATIRAIAAVDDIDYEKAEEKCIKEPRVSKREREFFDEQVLGSQKLKMELEPAES